MRNCIRIIMLLLLLSVFVLTNAQVIKQDAIAIDPNAMFSQLDLIQSELNLIRKGIGKPKQRKKLITLSQVSLQELYFESQALFKKANRLTYEVTGTIRSEPKLKSGKVSPDDILTLLNETLECLRVVKNRLNIHEASKIKFESRNKTLSDVANAILQASQELNELLFRRVSPADVFEQVTLAINYTENLLKPFNVVDRIPESPGFVPNKMPKNVYLRLMDCIRLLQSIAEISQVNMLKISLNRSELHLVTPSDVLDLSKIIVAEVDYLNVLLTKQSISIRSYYPGYKTPSDVYQRAGILLKQLELLYKNVRKNPNWLNENNQQRKDS